MTYKTLEWGSKQDRGRCRKISLGKGEGCSLMWQGKEGRKASHVLMLLYDKVTQVPLATHQLYIPQAPGSVSSTISKITLRIRRFKLTLSVRRSSNLTMTMRSLSRPGCESKHVKNRINIYSSQRNEYLHAAVGLLVLQLSSRQWEIDAIDAMAMYPLRAGR